VQAIPGTRSAYILQWPWVGSPPAVGDGGTAFTRIRNVVTGDLGVRRENGRLTVTAAGNPADRLYYTTVPGGT
jgi:hypothetical protein